MGGQAAGPGRRARREAARALRATEPGDRPDHARAARAGRVFPRVTMEIDQMEAVKEMVRLGLGLAVVPEWAVRREVTAGTLRAVSLGKAGLWRAWGLACLEQQLPSPALRAFVRLCTEHLPRALAA
ncbi:MAG: LysR family transcriptional regulator substrate-binding protein [Deltaproteobacteria bacterium]|nr:MAG: LysR family transcriptional regulator substrate-binding protein [Deltaproteobacteria bacterium]